MSERRHFREWQMVAKTMAHQVLENPVEALVAVGKENSELHEELHRVYSEMDRYRDALTRISQLPGLPGKIAKNALAQRSAN